MVSPISYMNGAFQSRVSPRPLTMTYPEQTSLLVLIQQYLRPPKPSTSSIQQRKATEGFFGQMVAYDPPHISSIPLEKAIGKRKTVPLVSDVIRAARDMGISFGDKPFSY